MEQLHSLSVAPLAFSRSFRHLGAQQGKLPGSGLFFFRAMEDGCVQARLNEVPVLCIYACAGKVSPFAAENTERLTFVSALTN